MMWPVLTKVQYESLPIIFRKRSIWMHIGISIILNWVIAPLIMLALAWATLPEAGLERERKGVILVGIARCIGKSHGIGKYFGILNSSNDSYGTHLERSSLW